jgi:acetyl-CoA carboxylase carboxyl transferase subunit beta
MNIQERELSNKLSEARDRVAYLRDIDIGIPADDFVSLTEPLKEAAVFIENDRFALAGNRLEYFDAAFDRLVDTHFSNLTPRQIDAISRSDQRPTTLDYAREVFEHFHELKGLEANSTDPAIVCGFARLDRNEVMVIGHENGAFQEDFRRGGSALPQGNAKAMQAMKTAERFGVPVISFIDTPGSWPLEEHLPAQRIARNLEQQYLLKVPHVSVIIGEGGSGGALALDVSDYRIMLDKAYYSVISVSGGAAIIARDKRHITDADMERAARNLHITAQDAYRLGVVHRVIQEPRIGVRKSDREFFPLLREAIVDALGTVKNSVSPFYLPDPKLANAWQIRRMQVLLLLKRRYKLYKRIGSYHTNLADRVKHLFGELYRIKLIHPLFLPIRKSVETFRKMRLKEKEVPLLLQDQVQPKQLTYEDRWVECPNTEIHNCQDMWVPTLFEEYMGTCPNCGYHFRLTINHYVDLICDSGSFREFNEGIESINPLQFEGFTEKLRQAKKVTERKCAMITGYALMEGVPVVAVFTDVRFRAGTLGSAEGEKFCRAVKRAMREKKPLVTVHQSGGARIEEGILALMQMVKTSIAVARFKQSGGFYISVQTDPTMAGVLASYASLGDFIIAEPNAQIGFAGIHVIEQTVKQKKPKNYQYSDMVMGRGGIDFVVNRNDIKATIVKLLELRKMRGRC